LDARRDVGKDRVPAQRPAEATALQPDAQRPADRLDVGVVLGSDGHRGGTGQGRVEDLGGGLVGDQVDAERGGGCRRLAGGGRRGGGGQRFVVVGADQEGAVDVQVASGDGGARGAVDLVEAERGPDAGAADDAEATADRDDAGVVVGAHGRVTRDVGVNAVEQ